jgi:beta-galactosidase
LSASGQDLSFVTVEVTDANGRFQPNAKNPIRFTLEGPGTIQATDNGNLRDITPFGSAVRNAHDGRAMAIIRTSHQPGTLRLRAQAEGLTPAEIVLTAKQP